jgi:hypothetical protein
MTGSMKNPHLALQRAIMSGLTPASVQIEGASETPWASATFSGTRHYFDLTVSGDDAITAVARLGMIVDDDQVAIDGHFVADIQLSSHQLIQPTQSPIVVLGIEALTVCAA